MKDVPGLTIIATDISEDAIQVSKINAGIAGVESTFSFRSAISRIRPFLNPVMGSFISTPNMATDWVRKNLELTYKRLGDFLKQNARAISGISLPATWNWPKKIGLKPSRRIGVLYQQDRLPPFEYELYRKAPAGKNKASPFSTTWFSNPHHILSIGTKIDHLFKIYLFVSLEL